MEFIRAATEHLEAMCRITEEAKAQMRAMGIDQWQNGYPCREVWEADIAAGDAWVAVEEGRVLGAFAYIPEADPSYAVIDGAWLTDTPYACMHRVCVSAASKGRGVAGQMFAHGFAMAREAGFASLRIDTHPDNIPMQRALAKAGFVRCGEIRLVGGAEDGSVRIGFEKML